MYAARGVLLHHERALRRFGDFWFGLGRAGKVALLRIFAKRLFRSFFSCRLRARCQGRATLTGLKAKASSHSILTRVWLLPPRASCHHARDISATRMPLRRAAPAAGGRVPC